MKDLIERLEKAAGRDRNLDAEIWVAVGPKDKGLAQFAKDAPSLAPPYTASFDAALALVPHMFEGTADVMNPAVGRFNARLWHRANLTGHEHHGSGINPAIAMCVASLKARAAVERDLTNMEAGR